MESRIGGASSVEKALKRRRTRLEKFIDKFNCLCCRRLKKHREIVTEEQFLATHQTTKHKRMGSVEILFNQRKTLGEVVANKKSRETMQAPT